MSRWNGSQGMGTALGTLLLRNPNQEHTTSSSETSTPHCFLVKPHPGRNSGGVQEFSTLRNSHTFLLPFGLPQTGHNPGKLQLPDLTPAALYIS